MNFSEIYSDAQSGFDDDDDNKHDKDNTLDVL